MKKLATAGLAVAGLLVTSSVASAQFCVIPLMIAAAYTSAAENRELTQKEATWCGLVHETKPQKLKKTKKTAARQEKKQ